MKLFSNWQIIWQKKPAKASDSLETLKEDYVSQPEPIQSINLLLRTCNEVSVRIFKKCYCNDDFSGLGQGTDEELMNAWIDLASEWSGLMKNEDSEYLLNLSWSILRLKSHLSFVDHSLFYLRRRHDKEIIDRLVNEFGYDGHYSDCIDEKYIKQLDRVESLSKTKVYELSELTDEYSRLKGQNSGEKSTEEDFDKGIHRLGKYQGYPINQDTTMIYDYTIIHNNFIEEIKARSKSPDT